MIKFIIKNDFLDKLMTSRFLIIFIISVALFVAQSLIFIKNYEQELQKFNFLVSEEEKRLNEIKVYSQIETFIYKKPNLLNILNTGINENTGEKLYIHYSKIPISLSKITKDNPLLNAFPSFDFSFLITVFFSISAFLLLFDSVCGEKEKGTLKLILSNDLKRSKLLFGKYVSGMTILSIPLIVSFIITLLILNSSKIVSITSEEGIRIFFFFLFCLFYISIFGLLALFISSKTKHSSHSLAFLFFIWLLLIIVIPNFSLYLASEGIQLTNEHVLMSSIKELRKEYYLKQNELFKKLNPPKEILKIGMKTLRSNDTFSIVDASKETMHYYQRIASYLEPLKIEYAEKEWRILENYLNQLEKQAKFYRILSFLSPASIFDNLSSGLVGSDYKAFKSFLKKARIYRQQILSYINSKGGFSSLSFITRKKEDELLSDEEFKKKYRLERNYKIKNYSLMDFSEYPPLDLSDMPRFSSSSFFNSVWKALNDRKVEILYLVFLNLFLFLIAYISFVRYDVR